MNTLLQFLGDADEPIIVRIIVLLSILGVFLGSFGLAMLIWEPLWFLVTVSIIGGAWWFCKWREK